jgi:hypothetical protein
MRRFLHIAGISISLELIRIGNVSAGRIGMMAKKGKHGPEDSLRKQNY